MKRRRRIVSGERKELPSIDLEKVREEVDLHIRVHRGDRVDKTLRFALGAYAERELNKTIMMRFEPLVLEIAETNKMYMKLARQSADRIEEVLKSQRACEQTTAELLLRMKALERQTKQAEARAAARALPPPRS